MNNNLDKKNQPVELKTSSMNKAEFTREIKRLFRVMPTSEDVRKLLVPNGVKNSAITKKGQFKEGQIFKYVFKLKDGYEATVKFHVRAKYAKGEENCLSKLFPTAQFILIEPDGMNVYRLVKKGNRVSWHTQDETFSINDLANRSHLPLYKFNTKM